MEYRWIIFTSSIFLTFFKFLVEASYGRILLDLLKTFPTASMAVLQWVGSMVPAIGAISVWQSLALITLFGYKWTACIGIVLGTTGLVLTSFSANAFQLLIAYGILFAHGGAFVVNVGLFIVAANFPPDSKFHVFATSCKFSIFPLAVVAVPISNSMIITCGWRITYIIYASIIMVLGLVVFVVFGKYKDSNDNNDSTNKKLLNNQCCSRMIKKKMLIIALVQMSVSFCGAIFLNTPIYILSKHAQDLGFSIHQGTNLVSYFGITEGCTRLTTACLGDNLFKSRVLHVGAVCFFLGALVNSLLGYTATTYPHLILYSVTMGALSGPIAATYYAICGEMLLGYYTNQLYSVSSLAWGGGVIFGMSTGGFIFDLNNSFKNVYLCMAGVQIVTTLLNVVIILLARNLKQVLEKQTSDFQLQSK